jgi:hypothetical protein
VDVPTNGNHVDTLKGPIVGSLGVLQEQTVLYGDVGTGWWLFRNEAARYFTGLAGLVELHYTGTLQDSDFTGFVGPPPNVYFGNLDQHVNVVNLTVGLHLDVTEMTRCRVAGAFPLTDKNNRVFDSEVLVQLERRF